MTEQELWNKVRMVPLAFGMLSAFISMGGLLVFEIWALFLRDGARVGLEIVEVVLLGLFIAAGYMLRYATIDLPFLKRSATARWGAKIYLLSLIFVAWYS